MSADRGLCGGTDLLPELTSFMTGVSCGYALGSAQNYSIRDHVKRRLYSGGPVAKAHTIDQKP
jgi:hypothetical protein